MRTTRGLRVRFRTAMPPACAPRIPLICKHSNLPPGLCVASASSAVKISSFRQARGAFSTSWANWNSWINAASC
jgi:hypothetical protein